MSEAMFTQEQLNKLKNAMSRVSQQMPSADVSSAPAELEHGEMESTVFRDPNAGLAAGTYLRVDQDAMAAWLYLTPPDQGQIYTKNDLDLP